MLTLYCINCESHHKNYFSRFYYWLNKPRCIRKSFRVTMPLLIKIQLCAKYSTLWRWQSSLAAMGENMTSWKLVFLARCVEWNETVVCCIQAQIIGVLLASYWRLLLSKIAANIGLLIKFRPVADLVRLYVFGGHWCSQSPCFFYLSLEFYVFSRTPPWSFFG